jgi:hypothetical protein
MRAAIKYFYRKSQKRKEQRQMEKWKWRRLVMSAERGDKELKVVKTCIGAGVTTLQSPAMRDFQQALHRST